MRIHKKSFVVVARNCSKFFFFPSLSDGLYQLGGAEIKKPAGMKGTVKKGRDNFLPRSQVAKSDEAREGERDRERRKRERETAGRKEIYFGSSWQLSIGVAIDMQVPLNGSLYWSI